MLQATTVSNTLIKPKPRTGITGKFFLVFDKVSLVFHFTHQQIIMLILSIHFYQGLSGQTEDINSSSPHVENTFPSPRPRTTIAPNNQGQGKLSSSNLLQRPTGINEGSVSSGSSRRSSNSCAQQQVQDDFHLNDTLRCVLD